MKRDPRILLWDAQNAANAIVAMAAGKSFADFDQDIMLRSAIERQFEIVGEALGRLARLDSRARHENPRPPPHRCVPEHPHPRLRDDRSGARLADCTTGPAELSATSWSIFSVRSAESSILRSESPAASRGRPSLYPGPLQVERQQAGEGVVGVGEPAPGAGYRGWASWARNSRYVFRPSNRLIEEFLESAFRDRGR